MREILFRGKRQDNGEWVYGELVTSLSETKYIILPGEYGAIEPVDYDVDENTVGQYTGLTDKNGVKIFEGDIVRHNDGKLHEVVFEQRNGNAYFGWKINELETWHFDSGFLRQLEVAGNIHDNPELIER